MEALIGHRTVASFRTDGFGYARADEASTLAYNRVFEALGVFKRELEAGDADRVSVAAS